MLKATLCTLRFPRALRAKEIPKLRGYLGTLFPEEEILHHHGRDGRLLYGYPKIQFKLIKDQALILGLAEGGDLLGRLWLQVDTARIGEEVLPVMESHLRSHDAPFGETDGARHYRFLAPWLALNKENARRFQEATGGDDRDSLLGRILIGNCLSMAKSFGYTVERRLEASCLRVRSVRASLKGTPMIGFLGTFSVNFALPAYAGIGKSVSRGFGTVMPIQLRSPSSDERRSGSGGDVHAD